MSLFGPYATGGTYWRFYFSVDDVSRTGNSHKLEIKFYLAHSGSGNYYSGAYWNFNYSINGSNYVYKYNNGSGTVANSSNYSTKTQIGSTQVVNITPQNPTINQSITVSGSMSSQSGNSVSPRYSNGGSGSINLIATASNPGAPTVNLYDNGNNTFKIAVTKGSDGTNNKANSYGGVQYKIGSGNWTNCAVNTNYYISSKQTVQARAYTIGAVSNSGYTTVSRQIIYYLKPASRPTPILSVSTNQPTLKSTYIVNWGSATPGNTDSPIQGYKIRLCRVNSSGELLDTLVETDVASNVFTKSYTINDFNPSATYGSVKVGDILQARLHVWSINGANQRLYYNSNDPAKSSTITIRNSGVVRVRVGNEFKEGQVYIRGNDNTWYEASGIYIRDIDDNTWHEST